MIDPKALADLEWGRLSRAVLSRCRGPMASLEALPIYGSREGASLALAQTAEAMELESSGSPIPLEGLDDLAQPLLRLSRMGALDGPSLNRVGALLRGARVLRQYLSRNKAFAAALERAVSLDPTLDALEEELTRHLDKDGTLFDHASDDLRRLRQETGNLRDRIVRKLEAILLEKADIVQDSFYTLREGRYVIPIRRDTHERFDGIVHGTSASGATLFIEPEALIPQGNRLKVAIAEQEREELRILALLSDEVRAALPSIQAAMDSLDLVDLRVASARFGLDYQARILPLSESEEKPALDLREMRHPLLLIEGKDVVPNDLAVEGGRALILSGPNAGGKTVALKAMGLGALMMRAGLPIPCAEGSSAGFFENILSDVGDDQSLMQDLSTFSAHIQNIGRIIKRAGEGSLVLLDELAGGTDPEEGAALAAAIVEGLLSSGAAIAVTTHYESLKSVGLLDPRARNASVGFDVETMSPSFKLTLDVPGASSALAVAERYGIPRAIIEAAEEKLPERTRIFEGLVRRLEEARAGAEAKERALAEELAAQRRLREELETELAKLKERDRKKLSAEAEKIAQQIRSFRDEIRAQRKALRAAKEDADAERVRKELEKVAAAAGKLEEGLAREEKASAEERAPAASLAIGDEVYVSSLRANATVIDGPSRGKVHVARGPMKLWVRVEECRSPGGTTKAPRRERAPVQTEAADSIDVRGMRAVDALSLVETALDRAYGASLNALTIVHGIGEGALKNAIRELLSANKTYVKRFRSGTRDEGGERVTVVELA